MPQHLSHPSGHFSAGRQCHLTSCGYLTSKELGPPTSSALLQCPFSAGPGLGTLSSQVSPLKWFLGHCIHLLQNLVPCTDLPGFATPATAFLFCCVLSFDTRGQEVPLRMPPPGDVPSPLVQHSSEYTWSSHCWQAQLSSFTWFRYYSRSLIVEKIILKIKM